MPNGEELKKLQERIAEDGPQIQAVPITIHRLEGDPIVVADYDSWLLTPYGIFASDGQFGGEGVSIDGLIPWGRIDWVEYDFSDFEEGFNNDNDEADGSSDEPEASAEGETDAAQDGDSPSG